MEYKIVEHIGSGLHGDVYLVRNNKGIEFVAKIVKMIDKIYSCILETSILSKLKHPYIVKMKEIFPQNDSYIIIEERGNMDIRAWRSQMHSALVTQKINHLKRSLYQILLSLKFLHSNDIIHCDIKPGNILVFCDIRCNIQDIIDTAVFKLCDFSVSRFEYTGKIRKGKFVNPQYRAPEIWKQENYNSKIDIWALGCTYYEILTGEYLIDCKDLESKSDQMIDFFSKNNRIIIDKKFNIDPEYKNSMKEFIKFIELMLITDPNIRPSADELLNNEFFTGYQNIDYHSVYDLKNIYDEKLSSLTSDPFVLNLSKNILIKLIINNIIIYDDIYYAIIFIADMIVLRRSTVKIDTRLVNLLIIFLEFNVL